MLVSYSSNLCKIKTLFPITQSVWTLKQTTGKDNSLKISFISKMYYILDDFFAENKNKSRTFILEKCFILILHWQCRRYPSSLTIKLHIILWNIIQCWKKILKNPNLKAAKVSCSLNLLLLNSDLNDLLLLQLLKLLLLGDQEVLLVGAGLLGDGVQDWGNGLKQQNLAKL